MLISILANLVVLYGLISWPVIMTQVIDLSVIDHQLNTRLIESVYRLEAPYRSNSVSLGIKITAASAIIADKKTKAVLWQKNSGETRSIASITKLITALVFLDHNPGWDGEVIIQDSDYREGGRIRVFSGERILAKDLFNAMLVASSNNSAVALARATGFSREEFVSLMNNKALELGMNDSVFVEPTGLDPQNVSTAADVIRLAAAALDRPEISAATSQSEYTFSVLNTDRTYTLKNTDRLLNSYLEIKSGKTGYLDEAGYCLVSNVRGPNGQEVLVAVLGSESEVSSFQEVKALAQWAYDNYIWPMK